VAYLLFRHSPSKNLLLILFVFFCVPALALTPLMFETFHYDFVQEGLEPIMSEQTYRWRNFMVAIVVIPSVLLSPWFFKKLGVRLRYLQSATGGIIIS
jgi:hypothetical protein